MAADAASPERRTRVRTADRDASPASADAAVPAKRTRTVAVRLTVAEESAWIAAALADGHRQLGAWVREKAVAGYLGRARPTTATTALSQEAVAEINAVRNELSRVGNNLNQIARAVNSGQIPPSLVEHLEKNWGQYGKTLARMADRLEELEG